MSVDDVLWWAMVVTGVGAAAFSLYGMSEAGRSGRARFRLDMASYVLLSASILCFVARGLIGPS
jgi:hypothetical protein